MDEDDDPEILQQAVPPVALVASAAVSEQERVIDGISIKLDYWSHTSGKRRAYVTCNNQAHCTERGCYRYATLDGFADLKGCFAHLHAWAHYGHNRPLHLAHKFFQPTPAQVASSLELV